jgi:3-oxoacyl-[acyl-carrier-protein] synthase II
MTAAVDRATVARDGERRVMITGMGVICCLGRGASAFWQGMLAGGGQPAAITDPYAHMRIPLMYHTPAGEVPAKPRTLGHVPLGPGPRMAVAAAEDAVAAAGLDETQRRRLAVVLGIEMGNIEHHEASRVEAEAGRVEAAGGRTERGRWHPMLVTASAVGAAIGAAGCNISLGNACSASANALSLGADMIRAGEVEVVLAGGGEGAARAGLGAFNRLGAMDSRRCRAFDRYREGTMFGNGAAMLVLESAEHAARRGAHVHAELAGAGWSCDAHHPTAPEPDGGQVIRAMREALDTAGLPADRVGAAIPHGTGTPLNDVVESRALGEVFGAHRERLPLLSLKAMIGHTGGAAGAFGALAGVLMLRHGRVPASPPLDELDPECPVWIPQDGPVPLAAPAVLVNAYAFGGNNVSLVVTAPGASR